MSQLDESIEVGTGTVHIDHVHQRYWSRHRTEVIALADVSLTIVPGEIVTVLGPSGCGKSTLLNLVAGFERPTSGSVRHDGHSIVAPSPKRVMVFQRDALLPWKTVLANVGLGPKLRGAGRRERDELARRQIAEVGLDGFENAYPHELSGGMQQRAELARALVNDPETLLMDEPFAALDAMTRQRMQEQLLAICARTGTSVLFVTHDVIEAVYLSDRIAIMTERPGRIKEIVAVDLPRPRGYGIVTDPRFTAVVDHILAANSPERS